RRPARLDLARRPRLAPPAEHGRTRCLRRRHVRRRPGADQRARLRLPSALPALPRGIWRLGAHRSEARGHRDDGRTAARARDVRVPGAAPSHPARKPRTRVSATSFSFEPAFLVLAAVAAAAYVWAARTDRPQRWRTIVFALGLFLVAASLNSPLETIAAKRLLLIHLLQNALIADLAPPLILLGLTRGMRDWLDARGLRQLRARYTLPAWLAAWYGTHIAGFYDWALRTGWALNIEHALLILGGLLFWWPLVSGRLSPPPALAYLGAGFVASSFLGL